MSSSKSSSKPSNKPTGPKGSPFAALAALRDSVPEGPKTESRDESKDIPAAAPVPTAFADKVIVARSKKGRGGRVVTTIAGVLGDERTLDALAHDLRKALGCGANVE